MKTLKTFLTEAPKLQPIDWKDAFEMCILHSIPTVADQHSEGQDKVAEAWVKGVKSISAEAKDEWDAMPADEKLEKTGNDPDDIDDLENFNFWFDSEGFDDYAGNDGGALWAWDNYGKGDLNFFTQHLLDKPSMSSLEPPPSGGDFGESNASGMFTYVDDSDFSSWEDFYFSFDDYRGFKGPAKQMGVDATKKLKTDWKMINSGKMAEEVCSIMIEGDLKITPQSQISKLMLNPTKFGINGIDKAEWGKFVKKPFTYDRPWMIGLEKQFKKYIG